MEGKLRLNKKQLIVVWMMVILLSGCSTTPNTLTLSREKQLNVLRQKQDGERQVAQDFLNRLKRGMSKEEVYSLIKSFQDKDILSVSVKNKTENVASLVKNEILDIYLWGKGDVLLSFLNDVLDNWTVYGY
jgi:hypothetical protein